MPGIHMCTATSGPSSRPDARCITHIHAGVTRNARPKTIRLDTCITEYLAQTKQGTNADDNPKRILVRNTQAQFAGEELQPIKRVESDAEKENGMHPVLFL